MMESVYLDGTIRIILAIVVVVLLLYIVVRSRRNQKVPLTSLEIMKERYERGEITKETYERAKQQQGKM